MGYLANRTVNYLNVYIALQGLLEQTLTLFAPIYLYQRGFSLPEIFGLLGLFIGARLPLRLLSVPIIARLGLKKALMLGIIGLCVSFPLLGLVKSYDGWLVLYVSVFGLFSALHWHCYHAFYTLAGEAEHRGKQISVASALGAALALVAPLINAIVITHTGFERFFLLSLPLLVLLLFLLSRCENIPTKHHCWAEGKKSMFNLGAQIHLAESSAVFPLIYGWLFVVYFYVGKMVVLGSVVSFGILIQILYQLWVGKVIDRGKGHFVAHAAGALRVLQVLGKALMPLSFPGIFGIETLSGITGAHHGLAQPTVMYNTGKQSSDPFWYWLFAESAFDIGTVIAAIVTALLLHAGMPLQRIILLALPGIFAVWYLTYRYFDNHRLDLSNLPKSA